MPDQDLGLIKQIKKNLTFRYKINFYVLKSYPDFLSKILNSKQIPVKNANALNILAAVLMS